MRRLLVMRHAKSDWKVGAPDHQRPLNDRGNRSAAAMGRLLTVIGEAPDAVLSSDAVRAATTAELAAEAGGWQAPITTTAGLYDTWPQGALEAIAAEAPDVERLMVVGHEPTWSGLVAHLTGGSVAVKTATVVGIDLFIGAWSEVPAARGEVVFVHQPRHHVDRDLT